MGSVVFSVPSVGVIYLWLCGIGSCNIIYGLVLVEQVGLFCVFILHLAPRDWDV